MSFFIQHRQQDGTTINKTFEKELLTDVLQEIKFFLLGCGYHIEGELDIVNEQQYDSFEEGFKCIQ